MIKAILNDSRAAFTAVHSKIPNLGIFKQKLPTNSFFCLSSLPTQYSLIQVVNNVAGPAYFLLNGPRPSASNGKAKSIVPWKEIG